MACMIRSCGRENRSFLQSTWLFGEMVSSPVINRIAQVMARKTAKSGDSVRVRGGSRLAILQEGSVSLSTGGDRLESLGPGGLWGETAVLRNGPSLFEARAEQDSSYFLIPGEVLRDVPVIQWKLMESFRKRLFRFRAHAKLEWTRDYAVGKGIDGTQKRLFKVVKDLADCLEQPRKPRSCSELQSEVVREGSELFAAQESIMERRRFPSWPIIGKSMKNCSPSSGGSTTRRGSSSKHSTRTWRSSSRTGSSRTLSWKTGSSELFSQESDTILAMGRVIVSVILLVLLTILIVLNLGPTTAINLFGARFGAVPDRGSGNGELRTRGGVFPLPVCRAVFPSLLAAETRAKAS